MTKHAQPQRDSPGTKARSALAMALKNLVILFKDIAHSKLPRLALIFGAAIALFGSLVWLVERQSPGGMFSRFFDGIWWGVVTIASVGYGDKVPISDLGRWLGIVLILCGVGLTSLISGTVASIFVESRIREGKGLQDLKLRNHIIVCGWNPNAHNALGSLAQSGYSRKTPIVLISMLEADGFDSLRVQFPEMDLRFIRGDHTQEAVMKKASAGSARACVMVPDSSGQNSLSGADERTILACFTLKSINPDAIISVEILKPENEQHLRRAGVENIVVNGEFSGFLLSASTSANGIPQAVRELLSWSSPSRLRQVPIPPALIGKNFVDAAEWFMRSGKGILVGVSSEEKQVSLEDLVSDDSSAIDAFIKRKFMEADIDLAGEMKGTSEIKLNPGAAYVLRDHDLGFIVG